jgi:hypothetical protein
MPARAGATEVNLQAALSGPESRGLPARIASADLVDR